LRLSDGTEKSGPSSSIGSEISFRNILKNLGAFFKL
jgi:hypothetical protein